MEYITLGEKTFVKANKIARDLGYTPDYIGQLSRSGKIEAKLVGRTWYVEESSVTAHKKNRYRSVKAISQKELRENLAQVERGEAVPLRKMSVSEPIPRYAAHKHATLLTPRYSQDEGELIPVLAPKTARTPEVKRRKGTIAVNLAEAAGVRVQSDALRSDFEPSELPKVRFKGPLKVESADDLAEPAEAEDGTSNQTREDSVDELTLEDTAPSADSYMPATVDAVEIAVQSDDGADSFEVEVHTLKVARDKRRENLHKELTSVGEHSSVDVIVPAVPNRLEPQAISSLEEATPSQSSVRWQALAVSTVFFIVLALVSLSLSERVVIDDSSVTKGYVLNIRDTLTQLYVYIKGYLG